MIQPHHHHDIHQEPTKDFTVKLLKSEIKFDVRFDSTIRDRILNREAHNASRRSYANKHKKVDYQIPDEDAEDWLGRHIDSAISNVCGELNWCVVDCERFASDELYEQPDEWAFHFHFARSWNGNINAIRSYIHKYVCEYILYMWYRTATPQYAMPYKEEAEEWLRKAYNEARSERVSLEPFRL